jgi:hypothetical protein
MLDPNGSIASHEERPSKHLFTEADLGELYALPATWDWYNDQINSILFADMTLSVVLYSQTMRLLC